MDIITHSVVGYFTGDVFGHPWEGAIAALVPDLVLGIRRRATPNLLYNFAHSGNGGLLLTIGSFSIGDGSLMITVLLAWLSHIFLDAFTHGKVWAPPIFYPVPYRLSLGTEWEWFNDSWTFGFMLALIWIVTCMSLIY